VPILRSLTQMLHDDVLIGPKVLIGHADRPGCIVHVLIVHDAVEHAGDEAGARCSFRAASVGETERQEVVAVVKRPRCSGSDATVRVAERKRQWGIRQELCIARRG